VFQAHSRRDRSPVVAEWGFRAGSLSSERAVEKPRLVVVLAGRMRVLRYGLPVLPVRAATVTRICW